MASALMSSFCVQGCVASNNYKDFVLMEQYQPGVIFKPTQIDLPCLMYYKSHRNKITVKIPLNFWGKKDP